MTDFAENQLVGDSRFWMTKYLFLSWLGAANIAFFSYNLFFKHLKRYVGLPLTYVTLFLSRNLIMKNCLDKIYFPIAPIYEKIRSEDKKKEQ